MAKAVFQMEPFTCPSCVKKIEHSLTHHAGVKSSTVLFHSGKVRVEFNEAFTTAEELEGAIVKLGYPVLSKKVA